MGKYWLSFADDDGFLGVCVVDAPSFPAAVTRSHELDINPGGEVLGYSIPDELSDSLVMDKLITDVDTLRWMGGAPMEELVEDE